jgi:cytochrome c553
MLKCDDVKTLSTLSILSFIFVTAACVGRAGAADIVHGQRIAKDVCAGCHAPDGNSQVPMFPKIAGLSDQYLVKQLVDLAKPADDRASRQNAMMSPVAASLSDADRHDVAAFFSSQSLVIAPAAAPAPDMEMGRVLYRTGVPGRSLPACAGCHGPAGAGLPVLYPRIGGQYGDYLVAQLKAFRDGTRRNSVAMHDIAFRMTDQEITAVADFAASLGTP